MKTRNLLYIFTVLFLISCGKQNAELKKQKLSPNELYKKKVDATCTIITDLGQGSGFFIDSNIIVTNYHVIANAKMANAVLNNEAHKYEILGYLAIDKINDIALLMVDYKSQNIIEIEKDIPNPGDRVYSISSPIGLSKTFSDGLISGKKNFDGRTLIQITVPISHGSSGCPIMNEFGDLVGIAVGGIEEGNNLNFCIPTSYLLNLLEFKESFPTALNTNPKQEIVGQNENQIPKSKNSGTKKNKSQSTESRKSIFMKSNEIVTNENIKEQLQNSFYNDKELSFFHKNKNYYNIDYSSVQFFEFGHGFYYENTLSKRSHCVKYLITFTTNRNETPYFQQYFLDEFFKVASSWATLDEKLKHINFWASYYQESYNSFCE